MCSKSVMKVKLSTAGLWRSTNHGNRKWCKHTVNCPHFVARRGGEDPASVVIPPLFEVWQGAQEAGGGVPGREEGEGAGGTHRDT